MSDDQKTKPLTYNSSGVMSQDRDAIVENSNRILAKTLHKAIEPTIDPPEKPLAYWFKIAEDRYQALLKAQERIAELEAEVARLRCQK